MKTELRNNQDFLAGLMFCVIGLVAVGIAGKNYPVGTSLNMGPGYFPRAVGGLMTLLGLVTMVRGWMTGDRVEGVWGLRPLALITLGIVAFGFAMDRFGMGPALFALFFLSTLGGHEFKLKEVALLFVVMTVICWAIFIYGLGLPYPLFTWRM
jgi:hypothetical protein